MGDVPARLGESIHQGVPLRAIPGLSQRDQIGVVLDFDAEVPCLDEFRPGHEHASLHRILELANVAGPGIVDDGLESRAPEAELSPVLLVAALEERVGDEHDVLGPVTQGGERQVHDRQAIVEVFPEPPGLKLHLQIFVGGRDHPGVYAEHLAAADPLDRPLLEKAEELHLKQGAHLTDFIEEERATFRELEPALPLNMRACVGALFVAEQLRLQQGVRDRPAVDRHKRAPVA